MQFLVQAKALKKCYLSGENQVAALDGVDFSLSRGSFTVLCGRSGSGKTTLLNMIGLLDRPDSGNLIVAGSDVLTMSQQQRAHFRLHRIGFIFQAYNLIRVLSARENVAYVQQLRGMEKARRLQLADHWLEQVGLADLGHRRPDQLSGGQQQRVAVARALASEPEIVLADEPTANLDSHNGESLMQLMRALNEHEHTSFLIASHDPVAMDAARELVTMQDGGVMDTVTI